MEVDRRVGATISKHALANCTALHGEKVQDNGASVGKRKQQSRIEDRSQESRHCSLCWSQLLLLWAVSRERQRPTRTSRAPVARHDAARRRTTTQDDASGIDSGDPAQSKTLNPVFSWSVSAAKCGMRLPRNQSLLVPRIKNVLAPLAIAQASSLAYRSPTKAYLADLRQPGIDNNNTADLDPAMAYEDSCLVFTGRWMCYLYIKVTA